MATTTPNLGLSKPEVTDKLVDSLYDFNGNADLLDALIGKLSDLNTAQKDSLVAAINEALTSAGTAAGFGDPVATVDGNTGTPSVEVTASGPDTAKVFTFTFKNLKGAQGAQGEQGIPGSAGSDGISPVVSVETISGGHRITITDAGGSQSFDVLDGASGSGSGDMTKAVYDPQGKSQDIFAYADAKSNKAVAFTVTLSASGWSGNAQTVSDARFLTGNYAYSVAPNSGSFAAYGNAVIYADNVTTAGQMQFHCRETPAVDLTVNVLRIEVSA